MRRSRPGARIVGAALAAAFLVKLGLVLWALRRGYEMGDGGYFLLNLNHPHDAPGVFQFYRLLTVFGDELRFDVIDARLLRLAAELLGSLALVAGVYRWARARLFETAAPGFPEFLLFCLLGTLLSVGSRAISYNDMTNLFSFCSVGCLFALGSLPPADAARRRRWLAALSAGFACGLQFTAKFPSALLLVAGSGLALALGFRSLPARERLRLAAAYATGLAAVALLLLLIHGGPAALLAQYAPMPEFARLSGYQPTAILARYVRAEAITGIQLLALAALFGGSVWLLRRRTAASRDTVLALSLAIAALALAWSTRALHPFFVHPTLLYLTSFLTFTLLLFGLLARRTDPAARLGPLLALLALPLVNLAGSNVPLSMRLPSHVLPWFVALAVLLFQLRERAGLARVCTVASATLIAITTTLFAHHHLAAPYGLAHSIGQQRHEVAGLPGLRVDADTARFLGTVAARMQAAGFQPGDPVFALDYMPGLVSFLGGTSPGSTFYMFGKPELNCFNMNRAKYARPPWFILGWPMPSEQRRCIDGLDFAQDAELVGVVPFPYERVYESFDAPGISNVYLYAPRARLSERAREDEAPRR